MPLMPEYGVNCYCVSLMYNHNISGDEYTDVTPTGNWSLFRFLML